MDICALCLYVCIICILQTKKTLLLSDCVVFQMMNGRTATDCGELLVSLCYQPANDRLTVIVLKAKNLPRMDLTGLSGTSYITQRPFAVKSSRKMADLDQFGLPTTILTWKTPCLYVRHQTGPVRPFSYYCKQEAQLPQRNSASAANVKGRGTRPFSPLFLLWLHLCVWSNPKATTYVRQACRP